MPATAKLWMDPDWELSEEPSPAARRSAARSAARASGDTRAAMQPAAKPSKRRASSPGRDDQIAPWRALRTPAPQVPAAPPLQVRRPRPRLRRGVAVRLALAVVFLAVATGTPLGLNYISLSAEWRLSDLEKQAEALKSEGASLQAKVGALSSSDRVKQEAERLGMVPASSLRYLNLGCDQVLAEAVSGGGDGSHVR